MKRIAGLMCLQDCADAIHTRLVETMCDLQVHAKSNDRNVVSFDRVCLATRLQAMHASEKDCQPNQSEDGRFWLVCDGAVYNRLELYEELIQRGYKFRSRADAEVILHAFEAWGEECLNRLRGMFAFVIYDRWAETMLLVRDRFGIKPLYYTSTNGHVFFASEMKPLIRQLSPLRPNREALIEWFLYGIILTSEELFQGIYPVPPGHVLTIHRGQVISRRCYYSPISEVDVAAYHGLARQPATAVVADLANILEKSVQDCLTIDAPVGTLCSGGVDSALLTALTARHRDITAFHISVPDDPRLDERRQAEEVASHLEVPLVCRPMDGKTFLRDLPRVIYFNEAPLTHIQSVAFYHGMQLANEHGVKILLVGDIADTILGGNWSRYGRQKQLALLQRILAYLPGRLRKALELASYASSGLPIYSANVEQRLSHVVSFFDRYRRQGLRRQCEEAYHFVPNAVVRSILATKLADLLEDIAWFCQRGDRLGMAMSVEYRVPFLNDRLVRLAVNLPWSYHTRGFIEKWALKRVATQFLPPHLVYGKKVPWGLPVANYLTPIAHAAFFKDGFCLEVLELHRRIIEEITQTLGRSLPAFFNLVNLEIWGRLFVLEQPVEQLDEFFAHVQAEATQA